MVPLSCIEAEDETEVISIVMEVVFPGITITFVSYDGRIAIFPETIGSLILGSRLISKVRNSPLARVLPIPGGFSILISQRGPYQPGLQLHVLIMYGEMPTLLRGHDAVLDMIHRGNCQGRIPNDIRRADASAMN